MTDDELFNALTGATMVTLVGERELDRRARHTARRIAREARREQVAGIRRWWVALVAGIAVLLAGVGAATGGLLHREPAQQDLVWCYTRVPTDLTDERARFGVLWVEPGGPSTAQQAVDLCYSNGDGTMKPIPDPVSQCVLPDGALAVLPIAKCTDIGLPESSLEPLTDN